MPDLFHYVVTRFDPVDHESYPFECPNGLLACDARQLVSHASRSVFPSRSRVEFLALRWTTGFASRATDKSQLPPGMPLAGSRQLRLRSHPARQRRVRTPP